MGLGTENFRLPSYGVIFGYCIYCEISGGGISIQNGSFEIQRYYLQEDIWIYFVYIDIPKSCHVAIHGTDTKGPSN